MRHAPALTILVAALAAGAPRAVATAVQDRAPTEPQATPLLGVGSAIVDVTVVDRFGAPLAGARVKLTGVVDREAATNDVGAVAFEDIPEGRYDVVASMEGLAASAPRVLDVPAFGLRAAAFTLKPAGSQRMMNACGGFDPASVKTLSQTAHLVLHVKVIDQQSVESALTADEPRGLISTLNRVAVLRSFKRDAQAPAPGSVLTVLQGGGRIDRGDYVDQFHFNALAPLNVGDEYVLFVHVDRAGTYTIVGAEEGAFRLRNRRVEALGNGGAAGTWNRRPAAAFFAALAGL